MASHTTPTLYPTLHLPVASSGTSHYTYPVHLLCTTLQLAYPIAYTVPTPRHYFLLYFQRLPFVFLVFTSCIISTFLLYFQAYFYYRES